MTDRDDNQPPNRDDDSNDLDYLDAGLSDGVDEDATSPPPEAPTERVIVPATATATALPEQTVVVERTVAVRDRSWVWPVINAVGLLVAVLVSFAANTLEFNKQNTAEVLDGVTVPFQPAAWVFTIWGLVYVLLIAFVIYGLLPAGRRNLRLQRISPFFLITNAANVAWIVLWHWEQFLASLITILVMLGALLCIYIGLRIRNPIRRSAPDEKPGWFKRLVLWVPFSVYVGWACVVALTNLMVWLDRSGWDGGPFSYNVWAALFMLGGALVSAAFVFIAKDTLVPIVFGVAYIGICQQAWGDSALVMVSAIVLAVVCIGLAGLASVLAFNREHDRGPFSSSDSGDNPPQMTAVEDAQSERA